jgi:hypothetical protein
MTQTINCTSCGAANQMPEGKKSMFCAFCGSSIKEVDNENKLTNQSSIITKPEISKKKTGKGEEYVAKFKFDKFNNLVDKGYVKKIEVLLDEGGELSLIDRNIKSLDEITVWFSDNELCEIKTLNLNNNKINSLEGIERFQALKTLSLNNNEIHELPKENLFLKNLFRIYLFGNHIEESISQYDLNYYSNIRFYVPTIKKITPLPDVVGKMVLSCNNLNINTVEEIVDLYSNNELSEIESVNFSNNKIKTLKGLSNFTSNDINFSNNDLTLIDDLPKKFKGDSMGASLDLNFNHNINLVEFTNEITQSFYTAKISKITIYLVGCKSFNYDSFSKISFNQIFYSTDSEWSYFRIIVGNENIVMPICLKKIGFVNEGTIWTLPKKGNPSYSKSGCFIATATMSSYDHPKVMELRYFRDNWLLQKSWGEGFVKWYYHYGAIAAKVIEKSFVLKKICYMFIVKPLVYLSRIVK